MDRRAEMLAIIAWGAVVAVALGVSSCATGGFGGCDDASDCEGQGVCRDGECVILDGGPPMDGATDTADDTSTEPDTDDTGIRDGSPPDDTDEPGDTSADTEDTSQSPEDTQDGGGGCGGQCGIGKTCDQGRCVSACQPRCPRGQQCADLGDGPTCYKKCNEDNSTDGCDQTGTRCFDLDASNTNQVLVCTPSECQTNADCTSKTCLNYTNEFGACAPSGPKQQGESCDLSRAADRCGPELFCLSNSSGTTGTCRKLCDPWDGSTCGPGTKCAVFDRRSSGGLGSITFRQGWCKSDTTSSGTDVADQCSPRDAMCDHGMRCLPAGQTNACYGWCRPGEGDCFPTWVCNNYLFAGVREIGFCQRACSSGDCGQGSRCDGKGRCRTVCSTDADCCNSGGSCPWNCNSNNLCE